MNNIYVIILVVYLLYYAGNIIYDGFLKKDKTVGKEDLQEYSVGDVPSEIEDNVSIIQIDDVENLNTPHSFQKREILSTTDSEPEDNDQNLEKWRQSFEAEQELDFFELNTPNHKVTSVEKTEEPEETESGNSKRKPKKIDIQKMLNEAETKIQLVGNKDGFKVYNLA